MITAAQPPHLTPDDYLQLEARSPVKHEYINGQIVAMAGASDAHVTIALDTAALLRSHLRGTGYRGSSGFPFPFASCSVYLPRCSGNWSFQVLFPAWSLGMRPTRLIIPSTFSFLRFYLGTLSRGSAYSLVPQALPGNKVMGTR